MKIAIFGGAFNPVHREHVNIARAAVRELGLDKIIVMPTAVSPHKSGRPCANFWQRYEMCRLAFSCIEQAEVSNYELTRGGVSYTYLTCEHFANLYGGAHRYFIIGADMLEDFPRWRRPEEILKYFRLAACARENSSGFEQAKERVEREYSTYVETIHYVGEKVSSTAIRTLAALNENFSEYVNYSVGQYINESKLYAKENLWSVKPMMTKERWEHSVRVALLCAKNAARAGISEEQAITMAALHDCAKYLPADSPYLRGFVPPEGVPRPVIHQYAGRFVAEHAFGICDEVILNAIECHASGKPAMTDADALLYLCDMLEESRTFDGVNELRAIFKDDLRRCLFAALAHQVEYLSSSGKPVYGKTYEAYKYLKENDR